MKFSATNNIFGGPPPTSTGSERGRGGYDRPQRGGEGGYRGGRGGRGGGEGFNSDRGNLKIELLRQMKRNPHKTIINRRWSRFI